MRAVLSEFPGESPVEFEFRRAADGARLRLDVGPDWRVRPTEQMRARLRDWLQPEETAA